MMMIRSGALAAALSLAIGSVAAAQSPSSPPAAKPMPDGKHWTTENLNVAAGPSYCYEDSEQHCRRYGRLYTWESAQQACRALGGGWRLPTNEDWRQLANHFGGIRQEAADLGKAAYTALVSGGSAGFDAVLGGGRTDKSGEYLRLDDHGFYWSATETGPDLAWFYNFGKGAQSFGRHEDGEKLRAFSVRCVKDSSDRVVFETEKGEIDIEVDSLRAPISAANFLEYVDRGFYDGGVVIRAVRPDNTVRRDVPIQVIQFLMNASREADEFPPIPLERTSVTGLTHRDGTVSMARGRPDTATASFSIVIGDQPEMDFGGKRNPDGQGFAVFGRIARGMDVVRAIHASPTGQNGPYKTETLDPPIKVLRAYRRR